MKKALLLGLLAVLVVGPAMVAYAAEEGAKVRREGAPAGAREGPPPEITLTPDQEKAMKDTLTAHQEAVNKLLAKAIEVLGDKGGRMFVMQSTMKSIRGPGGRDAPKGEHKREGGDKPRPAAQADR
jgi:hypothetical protein